MALTSPLIVLEGSRLIRSLSNKAIKPAFLHDVICQKGVSSCHLPFHWYYIIIMKDIGDERLVPKTVYYLNLELF